MEDPDVLCISSPIRDAGGSSWVRLCQLSCVSALTLESLWCPVGLSEISNSSGFVVKTSDDPQQLGPTFHSVF